MCSSYFPAYLSNIAFNQQGLNQRGPEFIRQARRHYYFSTFFDFFKINFGSDDFFILIRRRLKVHGQIIKQLARYQFFQRQGRAAVGIQLNRIAQLFYFLNKLRQIGLAGRFPAGDDYGFQLTASFF